MKRTNSSWQNSKGFTLVELAVVIVIIGVLAAFGVPKFRNAVERSKAAEAFGFLSAIRGAQERYHSKEGQYATDLNQLDISFSTPKYFTVGTTSVDSSADTWELQLTRTGASAGYGAYTVSFNANGYDSTTSASNIPDTISPLSTAS